MWFDLLASDALPLGAVRAATIDGRELVAWRGVDGHAAVGDRRCPHAWSDLATEGIVDGGELVCTAHFWRFAPDGTGTKCNAVGRRDLKAPLATYWSEERGGRLWVWLPELLT